MLEHNHEEADKLMLLHDIDVTDINPFSELTIASFDTYVLVLLVAHHKELYSGTIFYACALTLFLYGVIWY